MSECTGIREHEKLLAEYGIQLEHIEEEQEKQNVKMDRMTALLLANLGGIAVTLVMEVLTR